jgi:CHAT domain-containing protein
MLISTLPTKPSSRGNSVKIKQVGVPVSAAKLCQTAIEFREQLAKAGNPRRLLTHAQALYDWLIKPVASDLGSHAIDTLVVVPDGILRTIPFAALHDGKNFLVSRYALVITPGLTLTDPGVLAKGDYRVLLNGLSEGVQRLRAGMEQIRQYPGTTLHQ